MITNSLVYLFLAGTNVIFAAFTEVEKERAIFSGNYPHERIVEYVTTQDQAYQIYASRRGTFQMVTNVTTAAIPAPIQQVASAYKSKMEEIYGEGAVTNRALTRSYVAIDLSLNSAISADTGLRLSTWFEILDGYWQRGEVWSFPYDAASYATTNVSEEWRVVAP